MDAGKLVSDEIVNIIIVSQRIDLEDCAGNGFILDGYPKNIGCKLILIGEMFVSKKASSLDTVIELQVDDDALIDRITGRYTSAQIVVMVIMIATNILFHQDGVCDNCGSTEFKRRPDDVEDTVRVRLFTYYKINFAADRLLFCFAQT